MAIIKLESTLSFNSLIYLCNFFNPCSIHQSVTFFLILLLSATSLAESTVQLDLGYPESNPDSKPLETKEAPGVTLDQYPRILALNSYHIDFPWTEKTVKGIRNAFSQHFEQVQLSFEFMDARNYPLSQVESSMVNIIQQKYTGRLEAVIVSDNAALDFALKHRDALFQDIPIFFSGINQMSAPDLGDISMIGGFLESVDVERTISLIEQVHPNIEKLIILGDSSKAGASILKKTQAVVNQKPRQFKTRTIHHWSVNELTSTVSRLDSKSVILALSIFHDKFGETYHAKDMIKLIKNNTSTPVYTMWETYVESGFLGGWVISGYHQGYAAAQLSIDYLKNGDIPLNAIRKGPTLPLVNYPEMKKLNISEESFPPTTQFVNKPASFYKKYYPLIWLTLVFIILQSMAIFVLMVNMKRRKKVERRLNIFFEMLKHIPAGVIVADRHFKIKFVNQVYCQDTNTDQTDLIGRTVFNLKHFPFSKEEDLAAFEQLQPESVLKVEASFPIDGPVESQASHQNTPSKETTHSKSFQFTVSSVYTDTSELGYYIILSENIDHKKQAE